MRSPCSGETMKRKWWRSPAHPAVCSFVAGVRNTGQLESNLEWFNADIPTQFWDDLRTEGLLSDKAPTPDSSAGPLLQAEIEC